jgi:hypothetical protein
LPGGGSFPGLEQDAVDNAIGRRECNVAIRLDPQQRELRFDLPHGVFSLGQFLHGRAFEQFVEPRFLHVESCIGRVQCRSRAIDGFTRCQVLFEYTLCPFVFRPPELGFAHGPGNAGPGRRDLLFARPPREFVEPGTTLREQCLGFFQASLYTGRVLLEKPCPLGDVLTLDHLDSYHGLSHIGGNFDPVRFELPDRAARVF